MDATEIAILEYRWQERTRLTLADGRVLDIEPCSLSNNRGFDDLTVRQKKDCRLYNVREKQVASMKIMSEMELERELEEAEKNKEN